MSQKKLCKDYYKGIIRTLTVFLCAEIICFLYDSVVFVGKPFFKSLIYIGRAHYAWYIDMYIGLFLIIPFLNLIYNGLETRQKKQILLLSFATITCIIPTIAGIIKTNHGFWNSIYPVTYYFAGCYIREFPPKAKRYKYILLAIASIIFLTALSCIMSRNHIMISDMHTGYTSVFIFAATISVFCTLITLQTDLTKSKFAMTVLERLSRLVLGAYLLSYITDDIVYEILNEYCSPSVHIKYIFTVPISIIASLCASYFVNLICDGILFAVNKAKNKKA